ncbi:MAG: 3-dehydroquinate synthase [Euryarchaeota archaeon]|nr:3-dehydroquinate synthase [Euryarchaeota archaeon]|tara:strand:- start:5355 stop:6311 length:957 start_codon:yes stop_codon:yes gene_type:complete
MDLWLDITALESEREINQELEDQFSRLWNGSSSDVAVVQLDDFKGQEEAKSMIGMVEWILVQCSDWTMIPLENIIAAASESGTKIAASISKEIELNGAAFALEHGVDAIVVPFESGIICAAKKIVGEKPPKYTESTYNKALLSFADVTSIQSGGVGERVCVDLTERLDLGEGMLIGSSANAMAMIHGETIPSEYVPTRLFRVNAGAVHAYCLMADGSTRYLSELETGQEVAIVNLEGKLRPATIGRLKIERRPFLIIHFSLGQDVGQIIVQQAETVRLVNPGGHVSVTSLKAGDKILIRGDSGMRHAGVALAGEMNER